MVNWISKEDIREKLEESFNKFKIPVAHRPYLTEVLYLICDEEYHDDLRREGKRIPYVFEMKYDMPLVPIEKNYYVWKKRDTEDPSLKELVRVEWKDIELSVRRHILDFINKLSFKLIVKNIPKLYGSIDITLNVNVPGLQNNYFVEVVDSQPFDLSIPPKKSGKGKGQPGRRGNPQSNLAMYILYRYFNAIKSRGVYRKIAELCKIASALNKSWLEPHLVLKKIGRVKKQEEMVTFAERFEKKYFSAFKISL